MAAPPLPSYDTGQWSANSYGLAGGATPFSTTTTEPSLSAAAGQTGDITSLTQLLDQLNLTGQQNANAARIPNETGLESQSSTNIGNELSGTLSPDVINLITEQGAQRGVATGSPGSPNANAAYLQALGLTSLGQQEQGQTDLTAAENRNPAAPLADLSPFIGTTTTRPLASGGETFATGGGSPAAPAAAASAPDNSWWNNLFGDVTTQGGASWDPNAGNLTSIIDPANPNVGDPYSLISDPTNPQGTWFDYGTNPATGTVDPSLTDPNQSGIDPNTGLPVDNSGQA